MLRGLPGFGCCAFGFVFLACGARTELADNAISSSGTGASSSVAPPDHSCKSFHACGGNLVGSWTVNSACSSPAIGYIPKMCGDAKETRNVSGSMSFSADGALTSTVSVAYHDVLPERCAGGGCGVDHGVYAACTPGSAQTCICDSANSSELVQGDYQASGQTVVIDLTGQPIVPVSYCVLGDELLLGSGSVDDNYLFQLERD